MMRAAALGEALQAAQRARERRMLAIAAVVLVAGLAAVWPLYRAPLLIELNINEAWIAYHVDALVSGARPLYPPTDLLITNNYPPLGYLVLAALSRWFGNTIFLGRALSLVALLTVAGTIFAILRRLEVRASWAALAAVGYFATMCRLFDTHVAVCDPQMLAHALMTLGFLRFLDERSRGARWCLGAAVLMVLAGFVKHNIVAMPIAACVILWRDDRRAAGRFALALAGLAGVGFAASIGAFGLDFLRNLFAPRPYELLRTLKAAEDLHRVIVPFILWLVYVFRVRDGARGTIINTLCIAGLAESLVMRGASEVHFNAGYNAVIALWLAFGVAFEQLALLPAAQRLGLTRLRAAIVMVLVLRLLLDSNYRSLQAIADPGFRATLAEAVVATREEVARVAAIPGPVACASTLVCYLAGKPFLVDPINVRLRMAVGALPPDAVERLIRSGALTFVPDRPEAVIARH
jgi:hypothetical protein